MNTNTFEIKDIEKLTEKEKESGIWIPLTKEKEKSLMPMGRKKRRAYYKKHKKEFTRQSFKF